MSPRPHKLPLLIGLQAVKANFLPGLVIQLLMLVLVVGYYTFAPLTAWLDVLARAKQTLGYGYSIAATLIAGAIIPQVLLALFKGPRQRIPRFRDHLFIMAFWGFDGFMVDAFYRLQDQWFGRGLDLWTVATKVAVDQALFSPLLAVPLTLMVYEFKDQGYSANSLAGIVTLEFYLHRVVPALVTMWAIWIPLLCMLYSFPLQLQVPLFTLALSFWVLIVTFISTKKGQAGQS